MPRPDLPSAARPGVAVIVPNWNGTHLLPDCLDSLARQTFRGFHTLVVDNGSSDGSLALLAERYPWANVVAFERNLGFARAVNEGISRTDSELIALLNNDTEVEPRWLQELTEALDAHADAGTAASKILLFDRRDTLHSAGDGYRVDGVPVNRGVWQQDDGRFDGDVYIFGACAGGALYRRSMLDDIGLFDESLVAYCEDVDLSFRAQLAGYRCVFAPNARLYHRLSATGGGPLASYYCGRNFITVLFKNMPGRLLRRYWWRILSSQFGICARALFHVREPAARARLRGQAAGLLRLPVTLRGRRCLKPLRRVPDDYIDSILLKE